MLTGVNNILFTVWLILITAGLFLFVVNQVVSLFKKTDVIESAVKFITETKKKKEQPRLYKDTDPYESLMIGKEDGGQVIQTMPEEEK